MLDIKFIRENEDLLKKAILDKNIDLDLDLLLDVDKKRRIIIQEMEELKAEQNKLSKTKPDEKTINELKKIKSIVSELEHKLNETDEEYMNLMVKVPTIPAEDVPIGKNENENVEILKWGKPKKFDFKPKGHIELAENLDLLDFKRGVKVSGYRGYYVKNQAVMLQMGLMMHALEKLIKKGFTPIIPPTIVREFALFGSGYFSGKKFNPEIDEIYKIANDEEKLEDGSTNKEDKFLIGTAEPSLLAYFANEVLEKKDLPLKLCGFSPCFRSEIGSYGKNTKGLYRVHEFMKIEQVAITRADTKEAEKIHEELIDIAKEIHEDLELPYRQLLICTGDMGVGKYKQYDIEAWMPSMDSYGETASASNFLDWQSRRLNVKYKDENGDKKHVFMLNSTAAPSPRLLISIIENYQQKDGSILVPKVLQKYTSCKIIK